MAKTFNKGAFYRKCRMLHAYLSAAAFVTLLFFSFSGILLNHPEWFSPDRQDQEPILITFEPSELDAILSSEDPEAKFVSFFKQATSVSGQLKTVTIDDPDVSLRFSGIKGNTDIFLDLVTAEAEVNHSRANLTSIIHDMHRGKDAGVFWKAFIDISAIFIMAMSIAGLILFLSLRFRLKTSMQIIGVSIALMIGLYVFLIP